MPCLVLSNTHQLTAVAAEDRQVQGLEAHVHVQWAVSPS